MYYLNKIAFFLKLDWKIIREFGFKAGYYDFLKNFLFRKNKGIGRKIYHDKYENIKSILKHRMQPTIDKYMNMEECNNMIDPNSNIWIFWWQGIDDNTPEIVLKCIESVRKNKDKHSVITITQTNIKDYVELPLYYYEKLNRGCFTLTHFSDIVRIELLSKYGGIWMDSTIFLSDSLDEKIYDMPFYTINHQLFSDWHVCKGKWTGFFLASGRDNPMFMLLRDLFREYWLDNDFLICYLLIDCFIAMGYEEIPWFKEMIDKVEENNTNLYFLDNNGNNEYDRALFELISKNTNIFKLHYKRKFNEKTQNDKLTFYGCVIKSKN